MVESGCNREDRFRAEREDQEGDSCTCQGETWWRPALGKRCSRQREGTSSRKTSEKELLAIGDWSDVGMRKMVQKDGQCSTMGGYMGQGTPGVGEEALLSFEVQMETPWQYLRVKLRMVVKTMGVRDHTVEISRKLESLTFWSHKLPEG